MKIVIEEITPERLGEYNLVPQKVEVTSILQAELVGGGLGGIILHEVPLEQPYIKDYDSYGELPLSFSI